MKKILIVKTSSMGDVIHTLPALTDAKKYILEIEFDWVVEETFAEIPAWHFAVKNVIPVALRRWRKIFNQDWQKKELPAFVHKLREQQYDFIIDAQGLIKSAIITRFARGMRCGMDWQSAREPLASLLYKQKYSVAKNQHAITRVRKLFAKTLGYNLPKEQPDYSITSADFPRYYQNQPDYMAFIHGTAKAEKCWSEENWIALAKLAAENNYEVKIPWGNQTEYERAQRIAAQCENAQVLPQLSLTEIAGILKTAKGIVAIDTGLGHLSAALNVPNVSLYGPTNVDLIGTCGENQVHIKDRYGKMENISAPIVWENLQNAIFMKTKI